MKWIVILVVVLGCAFLLVCRVYKGGNHKSDETMGTPPEDRADTTEADSEQ